MVEDYHYDDFIEYFNTKHVFFVMNVRPSVVHYVERVEDQKNLNLCGLL